LTPTADFHQYGKELERSLLLKTSPIAVKILQKDEDIPTSSRFLQEDVLNVETGCKKRRIE
jgi:uncharacterized protein (DUF169 family)